MAASTLPVHHLGVCLRCLTTEHLILFTFVLHDQRYLFSSKDNKSEYWFLVSYTLFSDYLNFLLFRSVFSLVEVMNTNLLQRFHFLAETLE